MGRESSEEGWNGVLRQVAVSQAPVAHGTCYRATGGASAVLPPLLTPYVCAVPSHQASFPDGVPTSPPCDTEIPRAGSSLPGDQEWWSLVCLFGCQFINLEKLIKIPQPLLPGSPWEGPWCLRCWPAPALPFASLSALPAVPRGCSPSKANEWEVIFDNNPRAPQGSLLILQVIKKTQGRRR